MIRSAAFFFAMLRGFVIFLLLVGVGVQTLPLRVCAVEQAIAGQSCHDHDTVAVQRTETGSTDLKGFDGHAAAGGESDQTCRCELPKGGLDRHVRPDAPIDLLPAQIIPVDLVFATANHTFVPAALEQSPSAATAAITLPLLT
jgi:hypothetical protein